MQNLDKIMKPRAIAVIGASTKAHTIGSDIMKRLQEYGFKGKIYPVNPKGGVIEGKWTWPSWWLTPNLSSPQLTSATKKEWAAYV